jgi:hypothetical protein
MGRPGGQGAGRSEIRAAIQELRRMAMVAPRRVDLSLSDSAVVVSHPREEPWLLPFGSEVKREATDSVEISARADWENGRLVVTRKVPGGGSLIETYMPSVDGKRLTVNVVLAVGGAGAGVEFQRVYDPAPGTARGPSR